MQRRIQSDSSSKKNNSLPVLLDRKQLADYLGKSTAWCERARWTGEGPKFIELGRHVRYRVEDVLVWIDAQNVEVA